MEKVSNGMNQRKRRDSRFWRYAPLLVWMALIYLASTGELSAANTSRIIRPILIWLFPDISEEKLALVHLAVRKAAHFLEYSILALLAARAFTASTHEMLRRGFFYFTLLLVIVYSFSDELHQRFVASRTGSVYDSLIDISGGVTALIIYTIWRRKRRRTRFEVEGEAIEA